MSSAFETIALVLVLSKEEDVNGKLMGQMGEEGMYKGT
jgi:hypothetical protein